MSDQLALDFEARTERSPAEIVLRLLRDEPGQTVAELWPAVRRKKACGSLRELERLLGRLKKAGLAWVTETLRRACRVTGKPSVYWYSEE